MSAGKSHDAASWNRPGCRKIRSWPPIPDLENPISQSCSVPVVDRFCLTHGTSSCVMKLSYCQSGLVGVSAYQGSTPNAGSMMVRLYWSSASMLCMYDTASPYWVPTSGSTGSTNRKLCATPGAGLVGWITRSTCGPSESLAEMMSYEETPAEVLRKCISKPAVPPDQLSAWAAPEAMMPGAPPASVVSPAATRSVPSTRRDSVEPVTMSFSVVPAESGPVLYVLPSWVQLPALRRNSITAGLPLFQW